METDGHTGIHYDILHKETLNPEGEIIVTKLWIDRERKVNVVHLPLTERVLKVLPVLKAVGFREFFSCPLHSFKECACLAITPDVKWQDNSNPKHMAEFTLRFIGLTEEHWCRAKNSWETLSRIFKEYGREVPALELLLKAT